jgi:hypothetical protein
VKASLDKEQKRVARLREKEKEKESEQTSSANQSNAIPIDSAPAIQTTETRTPISTPPFLPTIPALVVTLLGWEPVVASPDTLSSLHRSSSVVSMSRAGSVVHSQTPSRAATPVPETSPQRQQWPSRAVYHRSSSSMSCMEVDGEAANQPLVPQKTLLHCKMCFRRVPLWSFLPQQQPTTSDSSSSLAKVPKSLDILKEHRHFCAYITPTSSLPSLRKNSDTLSDGHSDNLNGWEARLSTARRFGMGDAARLEVYGLRPASSQDDSDNSLVTSIARNGVSTYIYKYRGPL